MIIIDSREPPEVKTVIVKSGVPFQIDTIQVADYVIPLEGDEHFAFERKTIGDFLRSFYSKRMYRQIASLKQYKYPFLILEGELPRGKKAEDFHFLKSIIVKVIGFVAGFRLSIIHTPNAKATGLLLVLLWKKIDKAKKHPKKFTLKKRLQIGETIEEVRLLMLTGIPGIGIRSAEEILAKFGYSIRKLASATVKEIAEVKVGKRKLGNDRAKEIKKILDPEV